MEILQQVEAYEEVEGHYVFTKTPVVYRIGNEIYHAYCDKQTLSASNIQEDELKDVQLIPMVAYCPLFSSNFTRAPEPLPDNIYIKRPSLASYDQDIPH